MGSGPHKLYLVTGKGGVGKSAVAGALAMSLADANQRVLLVEVGETSYFAHVLKKSIGETPVPVRPGMDAVRWTGESSLRELFGHLLKVQSLVNLLFDNRVMRALVRVAPALKELAILGKLTSGIRKFGPPFDYDVVVFDSFSSGHFLNLLKVPEGILEVIKMGPMFEQSREIQKTLLDNSVTKIVIASLPEEMPMTEAVELESELKQRGYNPAVVCNRVLETNLSIDELKKASLDPEHSRYKDFTEYLIARLERQKSSLEIYPNQLAKLPLIYSSDSEQVIRSLSQRMEDVWKNS